MVGMNGGAPSSSEGSNSGDSSRDDASSNGGSWATPEDKLRIWSCNGMRLTS